MPDISKIELPDGNTYEIKDETARLFVVNLTYDNESEGFTADKTFSEINDAYLSGKDIVVRDDDHYNYTLCEASEDDCFIFVSIYDTFTAHNIGIQYVLIDNSDTWENYSDSSSQIFSVQYGSNLRTFSELKNALNEGMQLICYDHSSTKALSYNYTVYAWLERYKTDDYFIFTRVNEDGEIISYTYNSSNQWSKSTISNSPPTLTATYTAATYDLEIDLSSAIDADDTEY